MSEVDAAAALAELKELRDHIHQIQIQVAAVRHPAMAEDRITSATMELDAIVTATEGATNRILELAESIGNEADSLPHVSQDPAVLEKANTIGDMVAALFTECSFQDITGQRVTKVINTLMFVEEKVTKIIGLFGEDFTKLDPDEVEREGEANLLNGPQLKGQGVSQADIDNLFP